MELSTLLPYGAAVVAALLTAWLSSLRERSRYAYDQRCRTYVRYIQLLQKLKLLVDFLPEDVDSSESVAEHDHLLVEVEMFGSRRVNEMAQKVGLQLHNWYTADDLERGDFRSLAERLEKRCRKDVGVRNRSLRSQARVY